MKTLRHKRRKTNECSHLDTIVGSSAGIRRTVCKNCGNVSVGHIEEAVTKKSDPASTSN